MRRGARQWLVRLSAIVSLSVVGACHVIPETHLVNAVPARAKAPEGTAVVAVRWPMVITEPAYETVEREYRSIAFLPKIPEGHRRIPQHSTYYALELYAYLRAYLGSDAVLLEPYVVAPGAEAGTLKYEPIFDSTIPVALAIDLMEPPAWTVCCIGGLGDLVWTSFRVSVAPSASPKTCGLIGGSNFQPTGLSGSRKVHPVADERCTARSVRRGPSYTLMDYFASAPPKYQDDFPIAEALPLRTDAVVLWPAPRIFLPKEHVQRSARQPFSVNGQNPDNMWIGTMARSIAQAAATMDLEVLTRDAWPEYAAYYDPAMSMSRADAAATANQRAIRILAQAEKQWITKQNEKIAEALLNGSFGKSFRQQRVLEAVMRERDSAMSMANAMNMYSVGMNAGLFGGNVPLDSVAVTQGMINTFSAQMQAQQAMFDYLQRELGPEAAARDHVIQVDIAGVARQINADSRPKLREQLRQLYRERFGGSR